MVKNPNIVAFDTELDHVLRYSPNGTLQKISNLKSVKKSDFRISSLNSTKYISEVIEINRNVADEDLYDTIEVELYEELKLNYAENYKILYIENKHTEPEKSGHRVFDTFVINTIDLEEGFKDLSSEVGFVDYILPAPLIYKSLYNKQIFPKNETRVDCFITFDKNDAYLSIYKSGDFIYSKSFGYSLKRINEKISELLGQNLIGSNFYANLESYTNNESTNEIFNSYMAQVLEEAFIGVNEILSFSQRIKKIDAFSNIFISMDRNKSKIFFEHAEKYLSSKANVAELDINYKNYNFEDDTKNTLLFLNARDYISGDYPTFNVSHIQRPIPFQDRDSGKLMSVVLISILVGSLYPLGELVYSYKLQLDKTSVDRRYQELTEKKDDIKSQIQALNREKDKLHIDIKKVENIISGKQNIIDNIIKYKFEYKSRASVINNLVEYFSNSEVLIDSFEFNDTKINMEVISYKDKKITELIKTINIDNKFDVYTKRLDDNTSIYRSKMEVLINE
ncbi:MAG: Unknown protein [uncultured Campylobacterales bacterium]|uniref:C4-dicarboxylate ABC transporter n=1 Tax=uncultured Campylobacterales bacterium TaxID=352960 RepID=A0A6S6T3L1_9BACT|nr:MAG: Unknown protein [uncultured Campylobacterales bacterium]